MNNVYAKNQKTLKDCEKAKTFESHHEPLLEALTSSQSLGYRFVPLW